MYQIEITEGEFNSFHTPNEELLWRRLGPVTVGKKASLSKNSHRDF